MKVVEERITEVMNIRIQLQNLGLLTVPVIAETFKKYTNMFVREGTSQTFMLKDKDVCVRVLLVSTEGKQSGCTLIT